jgi:ATP dependent DNA ligase domain
MVRSALTRSQRQYAHVQNGPAQRLARELKGAKGAPFPDFIEPMQPTLVPKPPSGHRWLHEIKYDGYRVQLQVRQSAVRVLTRRGHDWTARFKAIADAASGLNTYAAVMDGEVMRRACSYTHLTGGYPERNMYVSPSRTLRILKYPRAFLTSRCCSSVTFSRLDGRLPCSVKSSLRTPSRYGVAALSVKWRSAARFY